MYKGIKVTFKNESIDWYDPCDEIIIDNGTNQYKIKVETIKKIEIYTEEESEFWGKGEEKSKEKT